MKKKAVVLLSGGLDSSATFSAMAYISGQGASQERVAQDWQHGFCAHYPESSLDETSWARMVTDAVGIPLKKVTIDPFSSGWCVSEAMRQVEDPYLTLPTPMLATYRAISNAGIKVTLDGHGADELFSGYGHLHHAYKQANPKEAAEIAAIVDSLTSLELDPKQIAELKHRLISRCIEKTALKNNLPLTAPLHLLCHQ